MLKTFLASLFLTVACAASASAQLTFTVTFTSQALSDLSVAEQAMFQDALDFWDDVIIDHRDGVARNWELNVNTFSQAASGGGVVLGSAGPSGLIFSNVVADAHTSNQRFIISTGGNANFNVHPDAGALAFSTLTHEIGHALGIGTLWEDNEVYNDGIANNSNRTLAGGTPGEYTGAAALEAWQNEFVGQSSATFVPVELGGGSGTAHGHWNEEDNFGQSLTGIVDQFGRDMRDELMTGYASPNPEFLSNTTVQSLYDIGFNVIAVPEPGSTGVLLVLATVGVICRRRKTA